MGRSQPEKIASPCGAARVGSARCGIIIIGSCAEVEGAKSRRLHAHPAFADWRRATQSAWVLPGAPTFAETRWSGSGESMAAARTRRREDSCRHCPSMPTSSRIRCRASRCNSSRAVDGVVGAFTRELQCRGTADIAAGAGDQANCPIQLTDRRTSMTTFVTR